MANTIGSSSAISNQNNLKTNFERLSSAKKINSAADDAAGSAIATRFTSKIDGTNTSIRNAGDGISLTQTAEGDLNSITTNLQRIRELALQSGNGTLNDSDREFIQNEVNVLQDEISRVVETSNFNGVDLLKGENSLKFQVGPNAGDTIELQTSDFKTALESIGDIDVTRQENIEGALGSVDDLLDQVSERRSELGATQNRFESTVDNLRTNEINDSSARSRIEDADFAKEVSELAANDIRDKVQIAMQSKANASQKDVLDLLNF